MKLTKYEHACVAVEKDGTSIVIDPGMFTSSPAEIIAAADAILLTHEHEDHVNREAISAALADRPDLRVYAPAGLAETFGDQAAQFTTVAAGEEFRLGDLAVTVHGAEHALIHPDIPLCANVGFLLDGAVYHPGDAYFVPRVPVTTLLLPTSGPWMKFGEAIDYVRAVRPEQSIEIHDALYGDIGHYLAGAMLGEQGPAGVPLTSIPIGQSLTV